MLSNTVMRKKRPLMVVHNNIVTLSTLAGQLAVSHQPPLCLCTQCIMGLLEGRSTCPHQLGLETASPLPPPSPRSTALYDTTPYSWPPLRLPNAVTPPMQSPQPVHERAAVRSPGRRVNEEKKMRH